MKIATTIDSKYQTWITANVDDPYRTCVEVTKRMALAFPELRRVRGHYIVGMHEHPHWWLETQGGDVVDPTSAQFPPGGVYFEHVGPEPVGKCPNCGGYVYPPSSSVCSEECARDYERYLMTGI